MSMKENAQTIAENVTKVYEAGYKNSPVSVDDETLSKVVFKPGDGSLQAIAYSRPKVLTLDDVAYEDKTYRDIFVTNNIATWGTFENGLTGVTIGYGAPEITDEVCQSGEHSLKCFGSAGYVQTQKSGITGTTIYFACSVKVDRYVKGKIGIQTVSPTIVEACVTNTTDNFETVSAVRSTNAGLTIYCGSWSASDLDGYVDDVVFIDLSMFSVMPSKSEMDMLYDNYVRILTGKETAPVEETYIIEKKAADIEFADAQCVEAFMDKVNEKAEDLGMSNSIFVTPSGSGTSNLVTSKDLVRLFVGATAYDELMKVWGKPSKTIYTKNRTPVQHDLISRMYANMNADEPVTSGVTKSPYYFMGGKTGSWQVESKIIYSFGAICKVKDKLLVGVVMDSGSQAGVYSAINELFAIAESIIETGATDTTSVTGNSACCCILPEHNPNMYENHPFDFLFEQNADTQIIPASITKVITAMVMLDYIKDVSEPIEFVSSDLVGGSGDIFEAGDIITYKDALYAMMLPSSNSAAQAVARCVGKKILKKERAEL